MFALSSRKKESWWCCPGSEHMSCCQGWWWLKAAPGGSRSVGRCSTSHPGSCCVQAGWISFYLVETTGLMENCAAVCIPAGLKISKSESSLVCKGSWSTSEILWILWMRTIENFTLVLPLHGCSWQMLWQGCRCYTWLCPILGHLDSAPGMAQRYLGDICGMSSTWMRCEVFQSFQARPGLGWVTAQGNVVKGWWGRLYPGEKRCWGLFWLLIDVFNERTAGFVCGWGKFNPCQNSPKVNENPWDKREVNCAASANPLESGWLTCK